ncbi:hypothetical protein [Sulfurisphaera tokodaii]|uniref:Uncharacterized protein n=2 Tax=Sulfurisphaera tokodaii TaxID=111955 RepID=F9VNL2_SULTO|nr:hypothetical protein [Sulfurisphaera tokodaii]BAK54658.1 hypothetical protein STK_17700 [Sulfurisphaera tokodaii str. 7]HII75213.1 hypothetical protein [Sulfurisphaera tokodaii]
MRKTITAFMDEVVDWFNSKSTVGVTFNSQGLYIADAIGIRRIPKIYILFALAFVFSLSVFIPVIIATYVFFLVVRSTIIYAIVLIISMSILSLYRDKIVTALNKYLIYYASDIVVLWSEVKAISTINKRFDRYFLVTYVNLGYWYVETFNHKIIIINNIEVPESKLDYVKSKFMLKI